MQLIENLMTSSSKQFQFNKVSTTDGNINNLDVAKQDIGEVYETFKDCSYEKDYYLISYAILNNFDNHIMHEAVKRGNLSLIRNFVNCGAGPNPRNYRNQTPLQRAFERNEDIIIKYFLTAPKIDRNS